MSLFFENCISFKGHHLSIDLVYFFNLSLCSFHFYSQDFHKDSCICKCHLHHSISNYLNANYSPQIHITFESISSQWLAYYLCISIFTFFLRIICVGSDLIFISHLLFHNYHELFDRSNYQAHRNWTPHDEHIFYFLRPISFNFTFIFHIYIDTYQSQQDSIFIHHFCYIFSSQPPPCYSCTTSDHSLHIFQYYIQIYSYFKLLWH